MYAASTQVTSNDGCRGLPPPAPCLRPMTSMSGSLHRHQTMVNAAFFSNFRTGYSNTPQCVFEDGYRRSNINILFFKALPRWFCLHQMFLRSLELHSVSSCWFWPQLTLPVSTVSWPAHCVCKHQSAFQTLNIQSILSQMKCDAF